MKIYRLAPSTPLSRHQGCPESQLTGAETASSLFATMPPERIGLNGEYDHNGLANRVNHAFQRQLGDSHVGIWTVSQRGGIVVLKGHFTSAYWLYQLIELALYTEGAVGVEVNGRTIFPTIDLNRINLHADPPRLRRQ